MFVLAYFRHALCHVRLRVHTTVLERANSFHRVLWFKQFVRDFVAMRNDEPSNELIDASEECQALSTPHTTFLSTTAL